MSTVTFDTRDEFNRKPIATKLESLLSSEIDISPLVIDGNWGTGKSEFCLKLVELMKEKDESHVIYIDSFKADHMEEPLLMILSEVIKVLPEDSKKNVLKYAMPVLKYGTKAAGKALVGHLLRQDANESVEAFSKEIQTAANGAIDATVNSLMKDHAKAQQNLAALQNALKQIVADKKIVIFIDELDRCKPDFSVRILEVIKHIFNIDGLDFVLVSNFEQLAASINNTYGENIDAQEYLDKFIKFKISLPTVISTAGYEPTWISVLHYLTLTEHSTVLDNTMLWMDDLQSFASAYIRINNLSLREVETLVRHIEVYHHLSGGKGLSTAHTYPLVLLRLFGIIIFTFHKDMVDSIFKHAVDAKKIANVFKDGGIMNLSPDDAGVPEHYQVLLTMLGSECQFNSDLYKSTEGYSEREWKEILNQYYQQSGRPEEGLAVIEETISTLNLG
ncbi:ATPase AAA [Vibrio chagasii]|nr:ATPase AAA [Vibrio chagasii]CAH7037626.1 ATPase AAA [Vibrio chagasii]CAH7039737.1 ATPase AAA [Vibrio chagasii]CAH7248695.1 ATPase AAA [Vibrio chagasii]CAH7250473.1 ATPase AAA [Vibrio chagasii]